MKHNEIEAKLKNAVSNAAPDVLENILHACDQKKGTVIEMEQKANTNKGKNKALRVCAAIAAAAAMLVMGVLIGRGSGHTPLYASDVAAIISLDVNPSVELRVDATEKVLAAEAHNADGEAVLAGMELAGTELNVAVNAIVGSMLKLGYIDELANSILISVEGMDGTDAKALESRGGSGLCAEPGRQRRNPEPERQRCGRRAFRKGRRIRHHRWQGRPDRGNSSGQCTLHI